MKWAIAAAGLVVAANGAVLVSVYQERRAPARGVTIDVCGANTVGGDRSNQAPALRLETVTDSTTAGLDAAGLQALGFDSAVAAGLGRTRDSTFRWPRERPAWVALRQRGDSLKRFGVVAVAPRREKLVTDSNSFVIQARVGIRYRLDVSPVGPPETAAHQHATPDTIGRSSRMLLATVVEVIPSELHLDRRQVAALREAPPKATGCRPRGRAVIASGASGRIWVESILDASGRN